EPAKARFRIGIVSEGSRLKPLPQEQKQQPGKSSRLPPLLQGSREPMHGSCCCGCVPLPLMLTFGAPPERQGRRTRPALDTGRHTWMCGVFRGGRMPPRLSRRLREPGATHRVCRRSVLSCARFLCTSKEKWLGPSPRKLH